MELLLWILSLHWPLKLYHFTVIMTIITDNEGKYSRKVDESLRVSVKNQRKIRISNEIKTVYIKQNIKWQLSIWITSVLLLPSTVPFIHMFPLTASNHFSLYFSISALWVVVFFPLEIWFIYRIVLQHLENCWICCWMNVI